MGKLYDAITDRQRKWITNQKVFFVATAPSGEEGHVNVSPKGLDTFKVIDERLLLISIYRVVVLKQSPT